VTCCLDDTYSACPHECQENSDIDGVAVVNPCVRRGQHTATTTAHLSCLTGYQPAAALTSVSPTECLAYILLKSCRSSALRTGRRRFLITYYSSEYAEDFAANAIGIDELGLEIPTPVPCVPFWDKNSLHFFPRRGHSPLPRPSPVGDGVTPSPNPTRLYLHG